MLRVTVRQTGPWIISQPGGAVADQRNRRDDERSLAVELWVAKPFGHPDAARIGRVDKLETYTPAAIAPFHHVNPAGRIAAVRIIITGEQIAILIEGKFLGIAQPAREDFEAGAIGIAAQDCAHFGFFDNVCAVLHVEATISHAEIEFAIRPEAQPVKIVTEKSGSNAVTSLERFLYIG